MKTLTLIKCLECNGTGECESGIGMFPCDVCHGSGEVPQQLNAKLNKRERRAAQLLAHYATCERLAAYLGMKNPDGKKISVVLWKAEQAASISSTRYCNGEMELREWEQCKGNAEVRVERALGKLPPGFFVNGDPRGYALKIDNEHPEGRKLIEACQLHTDMGGYGILSPEIDGN